MTRGILIPASHDPSELVDVTHGDIATTISADVFDVVSLRRHRVQFILDDEGFRTRRDSNPRATLLLAWLSDIDPASVSPLVGDALILGVDEAGESVDVDEDLVSGLLGTAESYLTAVGVVRAFRHALTSPN